MRLSATLAPLTLTASTTCAAVIDLSNGLGRSGGYTSQASYLGMLGGQPMTAAQQAYAGQQDQLRLLGFRLESGGDIALGQIFYHMAYGIISPLDFVGWGSGLPSSTTPGRQGRPSGLRAPLKRGVFRLIVAIDPREAALTGVR